MIEYERYERQKEILLLLNKNDMSVRDIMDYLNIDMNLCDALLRQYHNNGYLTRAKILGKYFTALQEKALIG
jgi:hypothetical protein